MNRKGLLIFFTLTGVVSLGFWWRGKIIHSATISKIIDPLEISYVIETQVPINYDYKRQSDGLIKQVENLVATASGKYALFVYHTRDGSSYGFNENVQMPAASMMKVPVMAAVMQMVADKKISLSDIYTMEEADRVTGSGPLQYKLSGSTYTISELLGYLGKNSDNTAWEMFSRRLGTDIFEDTVSKMGMVQSSYADLTTTVKDQARMFAYIYQDKAGGEAGKTSIYGILMNSIYEDRISLGLPETVDLVHKVGTDEQVWSDGGIVIPNSGKMYPFIIVIMNKDIDRDQAKVLVPEITKMVWKFETQTSNL